MQAQRKRGRRSGPRKTRAELGRESVERAQAGCSPANDARVIEAFAERGIVATPRVDVFTYNGWRGLEPPRQVKRGQKGVRVTVWIPKDSETDDDKPKNRDERRKMRAITAVLFHKSQTKLVGE